MLVFQLQLRFWELRVRAKILLDQDDDDDLKFCNLKTKFTWQQFYLDTEQK
jgi:hypothetical protein